MHIKIFIKKYKLDILLISFLLVLSIIGIIIFQMLSNTSNNIAYIYVSSNLVQTIDLSKETDERFLSINGKHGEVVIAIKKDDIKIVESTCPNKDCIHMGSATNLKPIVCAYNEVCIELKNNSSPVDIEVG